MIMAYPLITQPDKDTPLRMTLCLTRTDCTMVLPMVKKALSNVTKRVDARRERIVGKYPPSDKLMNELMQAEEEQKKLKELFRHLDALALK